MKMNNKRLYELLSRYADSFLDENYVSIIFENYSIDRVIKELEIVLKSENNDDVHSSLLFIRDFCIQGAVDISQEMVDEFRIFLPKSKIFSTLNTLLYHSSLILRKDVVYTIGKIVFEQNAEYLTQAYEFFRDKDPFMISDILGELEWLEKDIPWDHIKKLLEHPEYLFRWSVVELMTRLSNEWFDKKLEILEILGKDTNSHVALEARFYYELTLLYPKYENMCESDWKKEIKRINKYKPKLSFTQVSIGFCNYQKEKKLLKYTVEDIENFVRENYEL